MPRSPGSDGLQALDMVLDYSNACFPFQYLFSSVVTSSVSYTTSNPSVANTDWAFLGLIHIVGPGFATVRGLFEAEREICIDPFLCDSEPGFPKLFQRDVSVGICGDERDRIIQEYVDWPVNLVPVCSDFQTGDTGCPNIFLGEFTQDDDYSWFILRDSLCTGFNATRDNLGAPILLSSGYRNPVANDRAGGVWNSFHMHGRAVDMDGSTVGENVAIFNAMEGTNYVNRLLEPDPNNPTWVHGVW